MSTLSPKRGLGAGMGCDLGKLLRFSDSVLSTHSCAVY